MKKNLMKWLGLGLLTVSLAACGGAKSGGDESRKALLRQGQRRKKARRKRRTQRISGIALLSTAL